MRIAVYTSCSINYLAKARVLAHSLKKHNPDAYIVLCMNDVLPVWFDIESEPFDDMWTPYDLGYSEEWVFKHNVMELCTAVKGRALCRLIEEIPADIYAYFDPDVCVYGSLDGVIEQMNGGSIGLVPHITEPETTDIGVRLTEMSVTHHGIYNLGHLFVKGDENGVSLARWWADRLDAHCYNDPERGLFTDQRWMDLVPAVFDDVTIMREPNLDVASWNIRGREFTKDAEGRYLVNGIPLLTYHFSGTGVNGLHHRIRNIFNPTDIALADIEKQYENDINAQGQKTLGLHPFSYDFFDNGERVTDEIRKFYRRNSDLANAFSTPFSTESTSITLYRWLQENRCELVNSVAIPDFKLEAAFDALFDENYYLSRYCEVAGLVESGEYEDAKDHYIRFGSENFYNPSLYFESDYYFDVAQHHGGHTFTQKKHCEEAIESTLLWHYLTVGLLNNIEPNNYFDSRYYLTTHNDVQEAIRFGVLHTALEHFYRSGDAEFRQPNKSLNLALVYERNQEVAQLINQQVTRGVVESLIVLNKVSRYQSYDIELDTVVQKVGI